MTDRDATSRRISRRRWPPWKPTSTRKTADLVILGQPNVETKSIDNPLVVPHALSFLISRNWKSEVRGLSSFPESEWPTNISLLYYAYHIMVGLGTIFMLVMLISGIQLWRKKLYETRWLLWILMLSVPLPFIANTAGWMTAEIGRQPYLDLWHPAYCRRILEVRVGGQCVVHAAGLHGDVHHARHPLPVPGAARNLAWAGLR